MGKYCPFPQPSTKEYSMSISAMNGSGSSIGLAGMIQVRGNGQPNPDERAASIVKKGDRDGDGFISAEELSADAKERLSENPPTAQGTQGMVMGEAANSGQTSGSGGEESSDENYDQYDLNEDGVVTRNELIQAFGQGNHGLQTLLGGMDGGASSLNQRLANIAYKVGDEA
jgi:Ca2+-binding EF-hand superfamily protein